MVDADVVCLVVDVAVDTLEDVDVVGLVMDASERLGQGNRFVIDLVTGAKAPVFLILNKIDLMKKSRLLPIIAEYAALANFAEIVPVSAASGDNVDRLERIIIDRLPEGERMYPEDYLTDQPERFFASIKRCSSTPGTKYRHQRGRGGPVRRAGGPREPAETACTIVVERESQKPIIVGRGGEMIADQHRRAPGSRGIFRHRVSSIFTCA
jgi:GTP-binding protein Era